MKKVLILMCFTLVLIFGGIKGVNAEENKVMGFAPGGVYHAKKNDGYFSKYGEVMDYRAMTGEYAGRHIYCFAPTEELNTNANYEIVKYNDPNLLEKVNATQNEPTNKVTMEQLKRMMLIAYYGFDHPGRIMIPYKIAAQMLIYQTMENQVFTDVLCSNKSCKEVKMYEKEMEDIEESIRNHYVKPSFDGENYDLKLNEAKEITDNNGVLSDFKVSSCKNCEADIKGNTLIVTPTSVGKIEVKLAKGENYYENDTVFFLSNISQNMIVGGNVDAVYATVSGKVTGGSIEIEKLGENKEALKGAEFDLINKEEHIVCTITTDNNGKGKCTDLELGSYTLKERVAPEGYVLDTKTYNIEITLDNLHITKTINNKKIRGDIELYKEDKISKTPRGDASLNGAVYGIYKKSGEKVGEITTDNKGYGIFKNLEYGDYYLKEIKPSLGYLLDDTKYNFKIENNKVLVKVTVKEEIKEFNLSLIKTMSNGLSGVVEYEEGAEFQIFDNNTNELIQEVVTGSKGKVTVKLPFGTYKVCQKKGNDKTSLAPCFVVALHEDKEQIVNNEYLKAKVKVIKIDEDTKEIIPLKGIKFKIKNLDTGEFVTSLVTYPSVKEYSIFETNEEGILIMPEALSAGNYELIEIDQKIDGYLWNKETVKFVIDGNANIIYDEDLGPIIEVRFANKRVRGEIIVKKLGEVFNGDAIPLEGIEFAVYNEASDLMGIIKTDSDGYAKISNLKLGKYYLKEISSSNIYNIDNSLIEVNLEYIDQYTPIVSKEIKVINYLKKGNLKVIKKSDIDIPLPGVKFNLYDKDNNLIGTYITDNLGIISVDLPFGEYFLEEVVTKVGYKLNEDITNIVIDKDLQELEIINERLLTDVNLLKVNGDNEPLSGVKFNLYDKDNNLIGTYITDEFGYIRVKLPFGEYYFQEIETVNGYVASDRKLDFKIESEDTINLKYENYKRLRVPSTSSNINIGVYIMEALSLVFINYKFIKKMGI